MSNQRDNYTSLIAKLNVGLGFVLQCEIITLKNNKLSILLCKHYAKDDADRKLLVSASPQKMRSVSDMQ